MTCLPCGIPPISNDYYGIEQFNEFFSYYLPIYHNYVGLFEIFLAIIMFCAVLILRTTVVEYTNNYAKTWFPWIITKLGQTGLYIQAVLAIVVVFDGYKEIYDLDDFLGVRYFMIFMMISILCIKAPALYRAYYSLVKDKKFMIDLKKGWFV